MAMDLPEPYVGDWARVFDGPVRGLQPECWRLCLSVSVCLYVCVCVCVIHTLN